MYSFTLNNPHDFGPDQVVTARSLKSNFPEFTVFTKFDSKDIDLSIVEIPQLIGQMEGYNRNFFLDSSFITNQKFMKLIESDLDVSFHEMKNFEFFVVPNSLTLIATGEFN